MELLKLPECHHGEDCWYQSHPEMIHRDSHSYECTRDGRENFLLCDICLEGLELEYCEGCERYIMEKDHCCIKIEPEKDGGI